MTLILLCLTELLEVFDCSLVVFCNSLEIWHHSVFHFPQFVEGLHHTWVLRVGPFKGVTMVAGADGTRKELDGSSHTLSDFCLQTITANCVATSSRCWPSLLVHCLKTNNAVHGDPHSQPAFEGELSIHSGSFRPTVGHAKHE